MIKRLTENDFSRFEDICSSLCSPLYKESDWIGVYNEKRVHRAIKKFVCEDESCYEVKVGKLESLNVPVLFKNIPHRYLNKPVRIKIQAKDYFNVDTIAFIKREMFVDICRDSLIYGNVIFRLWDQQRSRYIGGKIVSVDGYEVCSDANGQIRLYIPLKSQQRAYHIDSDLLFESDTLYMPCGENDVLITK